jgi:hypothetical protein
MNIGNVSYIKRVTDKIRSGRSPIIKGLQELRELTVFGRDWIGILD